MLEKKNTEVKEEIKEEVIEVKEIKSKSVKKREEISKKEETKNISKGFMVHSRLSHPVELKYGGQSFMLPPRGAIKIEVLENLGKLPNGVYTRPIY